MNILGNAIARYLSKLDGLYSVELPETLMPEMNALVGAANIMQGNRALLVTDDQAPPGLATTRWRDVLGWRTTENRVFVWKRGNREPDTSFRSVVRPFISSRFPGAGGGECTSELLVRITLAELWESRNRVPVGASFDAFYETALWVTGILRAIFEESGSTPGVHWSNRFLEHWAGMLEDLDARLTLFNSPPDPRHAWEIVRVSGLPLPSKIADGNPFLVAPKPLEQREWRAVAQLWEDVVHSFIQPEGGIAVFLTALDHEVVGATGASPWRNLPWDIAQAMSTAVPAPIVGKAVFTAPASPTMFTATFPQYPIAPVPSWWGVSTEALENAMRRLRELAPLRPDDTCDGIIRLVPGTSSPYVLNTRSGTIIHAHTLKKWRARVSVADIRLRFKEQWQMLHLTPLEPQNSADGDAWIHQDSIEVTAKGATVESAVSVQGPGEQLIITIGLLVEYAAAKDAHANTFHGAWNPNRSLRVKLVVRRRFDGQWDEGRTVEVGVELVIPSPFAPTVLVMDGGPLVGTGPDGQDEFTASSHVASSPTAVSTPTITLKEEGPYDVQVYDGTLSPTGPSFVALAQPAVDGALMAAPTGALFPSLRCDLDDDVLVTNVAGNPSQDIAVFKVKQRSGNLSSGLLSAVRGLPAGRKQPSASARDSVLGQYQGKVTQALCKLAAALPNSLYQYVMSSSEELAMWPEHPGVPAPLFLFSPPSASLPGVGGGPSDELAQTPEWHIFMQAMRAVSVELGFCPGAENIWLSGLDYSRLLGGTVREYLKAHRNLVSAAKKLSQPADAFWAAYPFSVIVVEGRPGVSFAQLLAILLSPLHPARLAWTFAVTVIAKNSNADPSLLQLVEGWNIPCAGTTINPAGQGRQLVAIPIDPGMEQDFVSWSALAVVSDSGLADLPVFAAGQALPWGGRTGINARVVERAIRDYLLVHPHLNTLEVDVRSVSPAPRAHEIDEALLNLVAAEGLDEVGQLGGGTRVWDSEDRHGTMPTRDRVFTARGNSEISRPFEWRTYSVDKPPTEADVALVENASVHLAVISGETEGVLGLVPLRRFSPAVLTQLRLDQNFSPLPGEDVLGLAALLREIETADPAQNAALRAAPQVQALGIDRSARWEVLGTFNLDPALLSALVTSASASQSVDKRLLWEWRPSWMPVERKTGDLARRPYYVNLNAAVDLSAPQAEPESKPIPVVASEPRVIVGWHAVASRWAIIGKLAGSEDAVALDLDHPKTVGIFGYMGSGKSYLLGNLIESAVEPIPGINALSVPLAVVVFNYRRNASDRFELMSLAHPNQNPTEVERLTKEYGATPSGVHNLHVLCLPGELRPERQREYGPIGATELFFDARTLGAEDWELLMGEPGSEAVFARTIRNTLVDLRSAGDITLEALEQQVIARLSGQSRTAARLRFDFVRRYISRDWSEPQN